ncbi:unnamed protein product [Rotaria socialis]
MDKFIIPPIHRFTQVKSLILCCSALMPLDVLQTIMDFYQIEELDNTDIESISRRELEKIIKHLPRLNTLIMNYNPLFVIPSQIHTLMLRGDSQSISINNLWHTIQNVKTPGTLTKSQDMMFDIIDQFDHINNLLFTCCDFAEGDCMEFFIEKLSLHWLEDSSYRLRMNHFTYRKG